MTALTCPACAAGVGPDDLICFTCGANLPRIGDAEESPLPVTVMQETISPGETATGISATVLRITFPAGNVEVPAGTSVLLGRDPAESLVAAAFHGCENVSRRHALITVDDAGRATIRDESSTNGTFVNGDRLLPGIDVRLVDGDTVRLAADITGEVALPRQEPDPARLSRD
ncbi:MAG TPA: FHA domain-containing protein [Streptosporangiaceae bacterium]|nr:FHA domain-containing protein [Streptosporangiaceae bacterium]